MKKKSKMRLNKIIKFIKRFFLYAFLIFFFFIFTFPFYYVFVLATRSYETIFNVPPPFTFGTHVIYNFNKLITQLPFGFNFLNSTIIAVGANPNKDFFLYHGGICPG